LRLKVKSSNKRIQGRELDSLYELVMDLIAPGAAIDLVFCRMPLKAIIELLLQIAGALEYAHNTEFRDEDGHLHRGIYHGDIKPANILVDNDRAYLTDFMLPNMQEFKKRDFGHPCFPFYETEWYGTPMYMAPELFKVA
jgi:serine/threonine protein kinase